MTRRITRREGLKRTAMVGAGLTLAGRLPARTVAASEKLNLAVIGIGGRGRANLNALSKGNNIVALCDVDDQKAGDAYKKFPEAKKYYDFRRMLDDLHREIDGVVISTPDHTHFHAAHMAMQLGKHCYLEKPMAHSVWEVRTLTELAREKKIATQLGVQRHALQNVHRVVELVQSGAIGVVRECHAWVDGDRGMPGAAKEFPAVPAHLKWDLWLGPAADRDYSPAYCPYKWRFWWDFGTGETGNWGCHILDVPYWALGLKNPIRVTASGPTVDAQMTPKSITTRFEFPGRGRLAPATLHWSHAKNGPPVLREHYLKHKGSGILFIGSEGMLLTNFSRHKLYPEKKFKDFEPPAKSIPDSPGFHKEWVIACKGGQPATCNFDYSGPMTETVLLGNLAYRVGAAFDWDAENLKAHGCAKAAEYVRAPVRKVWTV